MKENNLFETFYAAFLAVGILPSYMYGLDLLYSYHYWYLAFHFTLIYCLVKKDRDTWWIAFSLAFGMVLIDWFIDNKISYACVTTFNIVQWLVASYGDSANDHLQFISCIQIVGHWLQYILCLWIILKNTRLKYGI